MLKLRYILMTVAAMAILCYTSVSWGHGVHPESTCSVIGTHYTPFMTIIYECSDGETRDDRGNLTCAHLEHVVWLMGAEGHKEIQLHLLDTLPCDMLDDIKSNPDILIEIQKKRKSQ